MEEDVVIKMPPVSTYKSKIKIRSITKGTPTIYGSPNGKASSQLTPKEAEDLLKDIETLNIEIAIQNRWLKIGEQDNLLN